MPVIEESWNEIAKLLGYVDEQDMLRNLYLVEQYSLMQLVKILGFSAFSIRRRLLEYGVEMRSRGGPNRTDKRRLKHVSDEEILNTEVAILTDRYKVHSSTIYAERRLRRCSSVSSVQSDGSKDLPLNPIVT